MSVAKSEQPAPTNRASTREESGRLQAIAAELRRFVLKSFPLPRKQQVQNSDALLESGMIDSQGVLEVVAFIEREFSIRVEDEELSPENFQSIDRIAAFICGKTAREHSDLSMR